MEFDLKVTVRGIEFIVFYTASAYKVDVNHVSIVTDYDGNNIKELLDFSVLMEIHRACVDNEDEYLDKALEGIEDDR